MTNKADVVRDTVILEGTVIRENRHWICGQDDRGWVYRLILIATKI